MTSILVVDDLLYRRKSITDALINRYEVTEVPHPKLTVSMIGKLKPSIILISRLSFSFNSINLFLSIKEQYPNIPVLLYVLRCPDAIRTLKQTISMALGKKKIAHQKYQNREYCCINEAIPERFPETNTSPCPAASGEKQRACLQ